jgi:hypothetical protein
MLYLPHNAKNNIIDTGGRLMKRATRWRAEQRAGRFMHMVLCDTGYCWYLDCCLKSPGHSQMRHLVDNPSTKVCALSKMR